MKVIASLALFLTLWLAGPGLAQDAPSEIARQAAAYYAQDDFDSARDQYEALIGQGVHDSAVYFNLGQTYLQLHDLGRALLNFRRAQRITPRDVALSEALARVRARRSEIQGDEIALPDSLAALTSGLLTIEEFNWLMQGLWAIEFAALGLFLMRPDWRSALRGPVLLLSVLLLAGFALWAGRQYSMSSRPAAVVIASEAPVMSGPGEDYLQIYVLHAAAELRILEARGDWLRFILPDEQEGWIRRTAVEKV